MKVKTQKKEVNQKMGIHLEKVEKLLKEKTLTQMQVRANSRSLTN